MLSKSFNKFYLLLLILLFEVCFSISQFKHIPRLRSNYQKVDDIFQNATIQKQQGRMKLYLSNRVINLLNVPDVMQATDYTCGPSSLSAVLGYYQLDDLRESDLAKRAKTTEEYGTSPQNLFATIRGLGINAEMREGMTLADLQYNIQNNQPVIVLFQAWADPGTDYKNDWEDGHYVVVIGYDKEYLYFQDPWILGSIGYIPRTEFLERWHDIVAGVKKVYNLGIVVKLQQKQTPVIVKLE